MNKIVQQETNKEFQENVSAYKNYIEKFCEIAERNSSYIDEWGDENLDSLSILKKECIIRIAKKVFDKNDYKEIATKLDYLINQWFDTDKQNELKISINNKTPIWAKILFDDYLPQKFNEYHLHRKSSSLNSALDLNRMSGVEFENYVANILKNSGYNVSGTPATGDQGADLIANKNNKVYIIQVKRYSGSVGNTAIQEVVAAKNFYNGNIAVVVTNSLFTSSAKELAKKNNVALIDKSAITNIDFLMNI